jgi:ABC-type sugar transport system ATPase subunit
MRQYYSFSSRVFTLYYIYYDYQGVNPSMLLSVKGISKSFYGMKVLDGIDFDLYSGEVHGVIGENGAGKSTLLKILSGAYPAEEGEVYLHDRLVHLPNPITALRFGISSIYQEPMLVPELSIAENVFLGNQPRILRYIMNTRKMRRDTKELLKLLGSTLHPNTPVKALSLPDKYIVSIAKAMCQDFQILIMDEPTESLTDEERDKLFSLIHLLKERGIGIIYTTHRLGELPLICDRITILRDGKLVKTAPLREMDDKEIVNSMVGRDFYTYFPPKLESVGEELLRVENLSKASLFSDVSFTLHEGEVLGIAGLIGSGKGELARTLFGEITKDEGTLYWRGKEIKVANPHAAIKQGIGFVDDNRMETGLIPDMSTQKNMTITSLDKLNRLMFLNPHKERDVMWDMVVELSIKISDPDQEIKYLSGGNQQKVMLGKWLVDGRELYILNEPTRGIDVASRIDLYLVIHELAKQGKSFIIVSSDRIELEGICTRVLTMTDGLLAPSQVDVRTLQ